jgi:hypothetical protein
MHQTRCHIKATSHTTRVRANQAVKGWHVQDRGKLLDSTINLGSSESEEPTLSSEYLAPGHLLVEASFLERDTDQESDVAGTLYNIDPADPCPASRRCEQGCEHANERRLSGTVWSKKSVDLTRFDLKVDASDCVEFAKAAG